MADETAAKEAVHTALTAAQMDEADADAASAIMDEADVAAEQFAAVLAEKLKADIPPIAEFDAPEDPQGGDGSL